VPEVHRIGRLDELRPVGTSWERILPGGPLDPRSKAHRAVYQVVEHLSCSWLGDGIYRERIERMKFERLEPAEDIPLFAFTQGDS